VVAVAVAGRGARPGAHARGRRDRDHRMAASVRQLGSREPERCR
jgi:hypothetical protein